MVDAWRAGHDSRAATGAAARHVVGLFDAGDLDMEGSRKDVVVEA